jgi:TDG/mug DNA glycosylase family protein
MTLVHSFEPIVGRDPRIVILGSMPGVVSLQAVQYYANPRNAFWAIIAELFDIDIDCSYEARIAQISQLPLILWDTLKACHREGSLDSKILRQEIAANDIIGLLARHPGIKAIAFNGAASEKYFNQLEKPRLAVDHAVDLIKLPSTSPANASINFEQKLTDWRQLLVYLQD